MSLLLQSLKLATDAEHSAEPIQVTATDNTQSSVVEISTTPPSLESGAQTASDTEILLEPTPTASAANADLIIAPHRASTSRPTHSVHGLVLAGCILICALGAWFWWQIQQLNTPSSPTTMQPPARPLPLPAIPIDIRAPSTQPSPTATTTQHSDLARSEQTQLPVAKPSIAQTAPRPAHLPTTPAPKQPDGAEMSALLEAAWLAYQSHDLQRAEQLYHDILKIDPGHHDALLGLAAIAIRSGDRRAAIATYQRLLQLNPQDMDARAGLATADASQLSENDLYRLLQSTQPADVALILGQYYAQQQRWQEAQAQFFEAFSRTPQHADLAFNLAVSLDHLQQTHAAADYYRTALSLPSGHFDRSQAALRLSELLGEAP